MATDRLRVPGEDVPVWLIGVFGLVGLFVAAAAAWQWLGGPAQESRAADLGAGTSTRSALPTPPTPTCPSPVSVPFDFDSAALNPSTIPQPVAPLVDLVTKSPGGHLVVLGHADAAGRERYNFLLSYRRAQAVAEWLVTTGVPIDRVRVRAAGSQEPIEGLNPMAGENRRAAIYIIGVPGCPTN